MQRIVAPALEARIQRRYWMLVKSHLHVANKLAAGVASLPAITSAFATTQAAWRFFNNERVTLPALAEPLRAVGRERLEATQAPFALLVHDWSKLRYNHPLRKQDLAQLTHDTDIGYELTTALLVSADDGQPLAPMELHLKTAKGVLSTRSPAPRRRGHLEQVLPTMQASQTWGLCKPLVHVIDCEADSVDHYRRWDAAGHHFLIRADDRRVRCEGQSCLLSEIASQLKQRRKFTCHGTASYHGRLAQLWVAETAVILYRPAKKNVGGKKFSKPGRALALRLIVVQVRNGAGKMLAQWLLLSNVPAALAAAELLARCYYWRWRIETFFKLLKSHGQQLEQWQQSSGEAIARRLLIAAMACTVVWQLQADESAAAKPLKDLLIRLSGRQTKRKNPYTAPALLAGMWTLLSTMELLEHYDLRTIQRLGRSIPLLNTG